MTSVQRLTPIIKIDSLADFQAVLTSQNHAGVLLKLSAEWCGPCKQIRREVEHGLSLLPANIQPVVLDIDESFELFAYLKKKRRVNGIPALLFWKRGNASDIPDDFVLGANADQVVALFNRIIVYGHQEMAAAAAAAVKTNV
jgi:thiol-disulfide isomerase/thioredoxin